MEPVELKYGTRPFMLSKLDAMGYTGDAAALARRIHPPQDEYNTDAARRSRRSHKTKYEMDQAANAEARDSVRRSQLAAYNGTPLAAYPQILAENPHDIFVQQTPRSLPYFVRETHVAAPELANAAAREPWRMTARQINSGSIKHKDTREK